MRLVRHLCVVLLLGGLLGLGSWQLQRLHWKTDLIAAMDSRMHQAPLDLAGLQDDEDVAYRTATASGRFLLDHVFYQFAIALGSGAGGYRLVTPLRMEDGRFLLVDRGWVPYGLRDGDFWRPSGAVTVSGILHRPEHAWNQPANDPQRNNWYGVDLAAMAEKAGLPGFLPYVLEVDAAPHPGDYPIGGQTRISLPNDHLGYALTWYGLALALLVIYGCRLFADYKAAKTAALWPRPDEAER